MVERLRAAGITDPRVLAAMAEVPRERFVPVAFRAQAYADHPLDIGWGQTISAPWIVAFSAAAVDVAPEGRVLEVGTGSGDGAAGAPDLAPFDAVVVTAMATAEPPPALLLQLAPNGTMVCPVGRRGKGVLTRYRAGRVERLANVAFVPLVTGGGPGL